MGRAGPAIKDVHVRAWICRRRRGRALLRRTCPKPAIAWRREIGHANSCSLTVVTQWWLACPLGQLHCMLYMSCCCCVRFTARLAQFVKWIYIHELNVRASEKRCTTTHSASDCLEQLTHTLLRISHLRCTSPALSVLKLDAPGLFFSFYYVVIVVIRASVTRSVGMVKTRSTRHASELLALQPGDTRRCFSTAEDAKTPNDRMVGTDLVRSIRPAHWPMTFPRVSVYVCQVVRS